VPFPLTSFCLCKSADIFGIDVGRLNLQDRKMQDWKMTDKSAGLENVMMMMMMMMMIHVVLDAC